MGISLSDDMLAGAFSGVMARIISAPFDVLKIRSQLQVDNTKSINGAASVMQGFRDIIKNEGFFALWKGNLSATYLWITYAIVQFTAYGALRRLGDSYLDGSLYSSGKDSIPTSKSHSKFAKTAVLFLAGAGAGLTSTIATYPFDIMRTQFTLQGADDKFPTISSFVTHTLKTKGIPGFYAGLTPAVVGITPYMGLNFAIYETMKILTMKTKTLVPPLSSSSSFLPSLPFISKLHRKYSNEIDKVQEISQKFVCGAVAGGLSKFIVYPLDTIKKRLQAQALYTIGSTSTSRHYNGIVDCFQKVIKDEGIKGLYRGIVPTVLKSVVATSVTFVAYETAKDMLAFRRQQRIDDAICNNN